MSSPPEGTEKCSVLHPHTLRWPIARSGFFYFEDKDIPAQIQECRKQEPVGGEVGTPH